MAGGPWNTEEDEPPPSGAAAGRLLIWLALGLAIYFLYGRRHSKVQAAERAGTIY